MSENPTTTPRFKALFSADLPIERIAFELETDEGVKECWIDLKPLDARRLAEAEGKGGADGAMHLISNTVHDWHLWTTFTPKNPDDLPPGKTRIWGEQNAPPDPKQRPATFLALELSLEFGKWLGDQCARVNGLGAADQGN